MFGFPETQPPWNPNISTKSIPTLFIGYIIYVDPYEKTSLLLWYIVLLWHDNKVSNFNLMKFLVRLMKTVIFRVYIFICILKSEQPIFRKATVTWFYGSLFRR